MSNFDYNVNNVSCYGDSNGIINVDQLDNSSTIYSFSINGILNTNFLSSIVFSDPEKMEQLNNLIQLNGVNENASENPINVLNNVPQQMVLEENQVRINNIFGDFFIFRKNNEVI